MVAGKVSRAAQIRDKAGHPIIDADGHVQEVIPVFLDYVRQVGGVGMMERFAKDVNESGGFSPQARWYRMSEQERWDTRAMCPTWWIRPTRNTLDRATASLPKLLYRRMDELGLDFAILYPTNISGGVGYDDKERRQVGCRAFNLYRADMFRDYADRLTPAAIIPMQTPQEAIAELEYAVEALGLKVISISHVRRPIPSIQRKYPEITHEASWVDTFGVDSAYDYDPFWARCVELGVAPSFHSGAYGWGARRSISNFQYNGSGHFAAAGEALCKSLFMGGVTRRFPTLKFSFLEGGVSWGCALYADMITRWKKRNPRALLEHLDPQLLDRQALMRLFAEFGDQHVQGKIEEIREYLGGEQPRRENIDDWAPCRIGRVEEIRALFEPHFYFGCEGDDPLNVWAFKTDVNPHGARLRAFFGSDIGHWDVTDMREVVEEAYEPVERGQMTAGDFKDFVFANPVTLYGGLNPDFFRGTRVESQASKVLKQE